MQLERRHIIGVISAEEFIKAEFGGDRLVVVAHMPFADHRRVEATRLQHIGDENFFTRQAHRIVKKPVDAIDQMAAGKRHRRQPVTRCQTARQHRGARRRTDRRRGVIIIQHHALGGQPINMRRLNHRIAGKADIAIAEIIKQNHHNIRRTGQRLCVGGGLYLGQIFLLRLHPCRVIELFIGHHFENKIADAEHHKKHRHGQDKR